MSRGNTPNSARGKKLGTRAKTTEKIDQFAELLAEGATVPDAAIAMKMGLSGAYRYLAVISAQLGWQAS